MRLKAGAKEFDFIQAPLRFSAAGLQDVFAAKNNKTLQQTMDHHRYSALVQEVNAKYGSSSNQRLGDFIAALKASGDAFYKRFLNRYGDGVYCRFELADRSLARQRGLYAYVVGGELQYIGRCRDSFGKRINQGYGKIHPKNCYRDGQATNCHLNGLIAGQNAESVSLWLHAMTEPNEIEQSERWLIAAYQPSWNIQLREGTFV